MEGSRGVRAIVEGFWDLWLFGRREEKGMDWVRDFGSFKKTPILIS